MNLPTEEDVLTALLFRACHPEVTNCFNTEQMLNASAWDMACASLGWEDVTLRLADEVALRRMAAFFPAPIEAVIADSERRLEVELARQAVLREAWLYTMSPARGYERLDDAVHVLTKAEVRVERGGGAA